MDDLEKSKMKLHKKIKNLRNIENYLNQPYFENLWIASKNVEKESLLKILKEKDKGKLVDWIRKHPSIELGEKSIRQLREDARSKRIPNYSRMNKTELLICLRNFKECPIKKESLSKRDMLLEIQSHIDEFSEYFNEAKIKEDYLTIDPAAIHFDSKLILEAYDWINDINDNIYSKVKNIKILLPDELWDRYRNWEDFGDHREVVLLNEALQNFRKAIINSLRPNLFKKSEVKKLVKRLIKEGIINGAGEKNI